MTSGADGKAVVKGLAAGNYYAKETVPPAGYKLNDAEIPFVVHNDGTATPVVKITNSREGRQVRISKDDAETKAPVSNAGVSVYDKDGNEVFKGTTNADGEVLTIPLTPGEYTVEEVLPTDSLYTGEAPKAVTVVAGKTAEVSLLNKLRAGKSTIRKVDTKDEPLAGATFLLESS